MDSRATTTPLPRAGVFRVGDLAVDLGVVRVERDGVEIPLPKLSFDLLVAFVAIGDRVATLDELMTLVWPGLVVSPETVSQRVKLLRDALGDDPRHPRYIAGVRGRGYRLIVPVVPVEQRERVAAESVPTPPADAPDAPPEPGARQEGQGWPQKKKWAFLALAGLCIVALAWLAAKPYRAASVDDRALPPRTVAVMPFATLGSRAQDDVLALGIPETILHQLAKLTGLSVIARTSSFQLRGDKLDAREVGRRLKARYLLEGTVQSAGDRLRVTAQLVDAGTGEQLWSLSFDRPLGESQDLFEMQDTIARKVAENLQLSLDARSIEQLKGRPPTNYAAYLAYLRGRSLLEGERVADFDAAVASLGESVRLDPTFGPAHVLLARAEMARLEYGPIADRAARFPVARRQAMAHLETAIALDPTNGQAYVERGYLLAYDDLARADADFRRGLALEPSYARGFEGLAALLYQSVARRGEALEMIDRARTLDPLEPRLDVTKATLLFYGPGDADGALELLDAVLERHPDYVPALSRHAEIEWAHDGHFAASIRSAEHVLRLDPAAEQARRILIFDYLELGDEPAAASVITSAPNLLPVRSLYLEMRRGHWLKAGELAYDALADGTGFSIEEPILALAIRMHARQSGDYDRAIDTLTRWSGVAWEADGEAVLEDALNMRVSAVALADVLMLAGRRDEAQRLLRAILTDAELQQNRYGRSARWLNHARAIALALLERNDAALGVADDFIDSQLSNYRSWLLLQADPAFAHLRSDRRWQALAGRVDGLNEEQRKQLARLRADGVVPRRP